MLIINGTVHTMEGLTIPGGYVEIRGNKIAGFGPMEELSLIHIYAPHHVGYEYLRGE